MQLAGQMQETVIDGVRYRVTPLTTSIAVKVMTRVLRMAAPAFADVTSLRDASKAVGAMLSGVLTDLDDAVVEYVAGELAKVTRVDVGGAFVTLDTIYEQHFCGRLVQFFAWVKFAAEVTYGPLLAHFQADAQKTDSLDGSGAKAAPPGV